VRDKICPSCEIPMQQVATNPGHHPHYKCSECGVVWSWGRFGLVTCESQREHLVPHRKLPKFAFARAGEILPGPGCAWEI